MVKVVGSMEEFTTMVVEASNSKLVVVDFFAVWCGPCKFVAPVFEQFVTEYPEVDFYKVDVDETDDVAAECGIQAMPTFQFFKGGEKIEEVRGADVARLKAIIEANK